MTEEQANKYSVEDKGDYISLKTWGRLQVDHLHEPAEAALALAKEKGITKLLDDIRGVDTTDLGIPVQTKGMSILWKLRSFDKVAILFESQELGGVFFTALETMHVPLKFRGFYNEEAAIAWLQEGSEGAGNDTDTPADTPGEG